MIISHSSRYIFFAVPKTATHSVREVLRASKAEQDWEQQVLFGEQSIPIPQIASIKHGHITARQIKRVLPDVQWREYYKFAFVRNPYDRFVSVCAFLNRENVAYRGNELAWMKAAMQRQQFLERVLVRPQWQQLCDENGDLAIDEIGRYETLQQSMTTIVQHLGLPEVGLKHRNASQHEGWRNYYDAELKGLVSDFYQRDLEIFDYNF